MKDREEYINILEQDSAELKKQLKPNYYVKGLEGTLKEYQQEMNKVTIQQKEFIKYLEDEINVLNIVNSASFGLSFENEITRKVYQEILQKYKEIIGDDK